MTGVFAERNRLMALTCALALRCGLRAGRYRDPEAEEERFAWVLHIDLPTGQVTLHIDADDECPSWKALPVIERTWDGHTKSEAYEAAARFVAQVGKAEEAARVGWRVFGEAYGRPPSLQAVDVPTRPGTARIFCALDYASSLLLAGAAISGLSWWLGVEDLRPLNSTRMFAMVLVGFAAKAMVMARRKAEAELRLARATTFGVLIALAISGVLVATGMWFGPFEVLWCLLVWVLVARAIAKAGSA